MADELNKLRVFTQVVEAGGFSAVARAADVAPSSISRQINELEQQLGVRLFNRTTRKLSLTEAGQIYYERVLKVISAADEARLAIAELGQPTGILRFTAPTGIGREVMITAIPAFLAQYPGIRVVASMTDAMVDIITENIDVAIRVGQLADSTLKARKIGTSKRIVCASKNYLKQHGEPRKPADLEHHACITWREHPGHNVWAFKSKRGLEKVKVTGPFFARSADSLVAAAVAGMGMVLLPDWNLGEELRVGKLKVVLTNYESVPANSAIWAVHAHEKFVPPKIRAFIDFLIQRFANQRFG